MPFRMELSEAHKQRNERVVRLLAQQRRNIPKKEVYEQYDRIKSQSSRRRNEVSKPAEEGDNQEDS